MNGTASNRGKGERPRGGQHNVMEVADFEGKTIPCPICNVALRLKASRKQKPYCLCLECGIQIFFRGQTGIRRLYKIISGEEAVAAEFNGPARAISLYNRLQGLKRQRERLEDQQGLIFRDSDRDKVIEALDAEVERVRSQLEKETESAREKKK